jgi:hypothetical protein
MKKAFTFIGFDDPNPMLFTQTARNNGVDDSNRHSCMELGNFLAGSTEILVMGHCDGHTILGLKGKDVAKKMVERGLANTNVKIILVACRAGMGFIESFHLGLLHELKTNKFNGEVFASQENVTSQLKGAKSGKLVVDEKSASALDQAHGEHIHAQQQAEARANKKKEDPFADLNPFK